MTTRVIYTWRTTVEECGCCSYNDNWIAYQYEDGTILEKSNYWDNAGIPTFHNKEELLEWLGEGDWEIDEEESEFC